MRHRSWQLAYKLPLKEKDVKGVYASAWQKCLVQFKVYKAINVFHKVYFGLEFNVRSVIF